MYMYKHVVGIRNVDLDLKTRSKISEVENRSGKQTHRWFKKENDECYYIKGWELEKFCMIYKNPVNENCSHRLVWHHTHDMENGKWNGLKFSRRRGKFGQVIPLF